MPRLYVVDASVVVSGVLRFGQGSTPAVILDRMLSGRLPFLLSADPLGEYRRVLLRPRLVAGHGWGGPQVNVLLAALTTAAYLRQPSASRMTRRLPAPRVTSMSRGCSPASPGRRS